MTLTLTKGPIGQYDPDTKDLASKFKKLALALIGNANQKATALNDICDEPDFVVEATTSTNDAVTLANALVNLNTEGVTFPAGYVRQIKLKYTYASSATVKGYSERQFLVIGAANTPVLSILPTDFTYSPTGTALPAGNPFPDARVISALPLGSAATPTYPEARLAVTTTPSPDQLYVGVLGISAVPIRWRVHVHVGRLVPIAAP